MNSQYEFLNFSLKIISKYNECLIQAECVSKTHNSKKKKINKS